MGEAFYCRVPVCSLSFGLRSPNLNSVGEPVTVRLTPLSLTSLSSTSWSWTALHNGLRSQWSWRPLHLSAYLDYLFNKTLVNIHHSYATHVPL